MTRQEMKIFDNIHAVIFDLDGTLVDSMGMWHKIDEIYLKKKGMETPNDLTKIVEGMSFTETATYFKKRFALEDTVESIKAEWTEMMYDVYVNEAALKPCALEFIKILKEKKLKLGVGTSNSRQLAEGVLSARGIDSFLDTLCTSCEVKRGKPYPDVFLKAAENMKVSPEKCIVFEDTHAGILAAKRAGMKAIAVHEETSVAFKASIEKDADMYTDGFCDILDLYF